jgi:hypothetical protein
MLDDLQKMTIAFPHTLTEKSETPNEKNRIDATTASFRGCEIPLKMMMLIATFGIGFTFSRGTHDKFP